MEVQVADDDIIDDEADIATMVRCRTIGQIGSSMLDVW